MVIYNLAVQIEENSEDFYLKAAEQAEDRVISEIFKILSEDEKRHNQILETVIREVPVYICSDSLERINYLFRKRDLCIDIDKVRDYHIEEYKEALQDEKDCAYLYKRMVEETEEKHMKEIFTKLMEEEEKHVIILENIIDILNKPSEWVESLEFNILEKYAV